MTLRRKAAGLLTAIAVAVSLTPPAPAAAAEIGPLQIINYNSGKCIDIKDKSTAVGATIHQWTCRREPHQLWWFTHQPPIAGTASFDLRPQHMILRDKPGCITNPGFSTFTGVDMKLTTCTAPAGFDTSQGFRLMLGWDQTTPLPAPGPQYRYRFIQEFSQMCLQIEGGSTANGAKLEQARCDGSAKQLWIVMY